MPLAYVDASIWQPLYTASMSPIVLPLAKVDTAILVVLLALATALILHPLAHIDAPVGALLPLQTSQCPVAMSLTVLPLTLVEGLTHSHVAAPAPSVLCSSLLPGDNAECARRWQHLCHTTCSTQLSLKWNKVGGHEAGQGTVVCHTKRCQAPGSRERDGG